LSQWFELGGVGLLYRVDRPNHPRHLGNTWTSDLVQGVRSRWSGPTSCSGTLDRGSPNLTGADEAKIFEICWANSGRAGVRVNIAACK